jgi:uncharacterized protein YegL
MLASLVTKLVNRRQKNDENGSIICFTMVVFSIMMLVGGAAIDLARYENSRATLQYNLDRAVLAAASLKQASDPQTVVDDYMSRITTNEPFEIHVTSSVADYSRRVAATATANIDMWFLSMAGINEMPAKVTSVAQEQKTQLEISLVLDVSGSMGSNNRLVNLKVAAKEFVDTLLADIEEDSVAISIVPFNSNTAPSQEVFDALNVAQTHNYTTCLDFEDASFEQAAIDPTTIVDQAMFTSYYGSFENAHLASSSCNDQGYFQIMPYASDAATLHAKIDSLQAAGNTAGHIGIKWGLALLDPQFQSVVDHLIDEDEISAGLTRMPVAYDDEETSKIIVMMSDGANTTEFRLGSAYNSGQSDLMEVARNGTAPLNYLRATDGSQFYSVADEVWISQAAFEALDTTEANYQSTRRMDWPEAWGHMSTEYYRGVMNDAGPSNDFLSGTARNGWEADQMMEDSCDAAAVEGVSVYTIGFEMSSESAKTQLRECASSVSHFYDANGTQISEVFNSIAQSILKLKLTQ